MKPWSASQKESTLKWTDCGMTYEVKTKTTIRDPIQEGYEIKTTIRDPIPDRPGQNHYSRPHSGQAKSKPLFETPFRKSEHLGNSDCTPELFPTAWEIYPLE